MSLTVCKFYDSNQTCRFGNRCKFLHSQRPPPFSSTVSKEEHEVSGVISCTQQSAPPELIDQGNLEPNPQNDSDLSRNPAATSQQQHSSSNYSGTNACIVQKTVCPYFARGWCRYGRFCRLSHALPQRVSQSDTITQVRSSNGKEKYIPPRFRQTREDLAYRSAEDKAQAENVGSKKKASEGSTTNTVPRNRGRNQQRQIGKICAYFKSGQCKKGVDCKFLHEHRTDTLKGVNPAQQEVTSAPALVTREEKDGSGKNLAPNVVKPAFTAKSKTQGFQRMTQRPFGSQSHQVFTLAKLDEVGRDKIRNGEIEAIKRRFPKDKITHRNDGETFVATIKFAPSDPDWPFDVREFTIAFRIPSAYPKETLNVTLPLDQDLPTTVRRYVEVTIQEWILDRQEHLTQNGQVELLFRPFLRWLDRTIEEIITEALHQLKRELTAKAAGLEFVPAKKLQARFNSFSKSSGDDGKAVASDNDEETDDNSDDENQDSISEDEEEEESGNVNQSLELQPQQRGTEISLKHLQLKENAAALLFQRLKIVLQCGRCKGHSDLYVAQGNVTSVSCHRCNNEMYVTYRPGLLHQFSSVLGYLDVDGCQAFDIVLQDCRASVSCMACNKQTTMDGLVTGQVIDGWCKACNAKFKIATEAVKLAQLAPSGIDTNSAPVVKAASSKPKKPPKDPSIREGYPLPEFGTCKHYKQSYRWLRFPCCGKAFPCDVCHDKLEDHEMTLANRMICGHCCKEQNYSASRPCSGCGEHMTKVRSAHWEGGSGCRDKISMSKGDQQKYKNMNKTVSNKKKMESGSKKKTTKLRHL